MTFSQNTCTVCDSLNLNATDMHQMSGSLAVCSVRSKNLDYFLHITVMSVHFIYKNVIISCTVTFIKLLLAVSVCVQ